MTNRTFGAALIAIAFAAVLGVGAMAVWSEKQLYDVTAAAGHDRFAIETPELRIEVEGSRAAMDEHSPEILGRIESVDPDLIRPGIALWASPRGDDPVLIGHVVSVEPRGTAL